MPGDISGNRKTQVVLRQNTPFLEVQQAFLRGTHFCIAHASYESPLLTTKRKKRGKKFRWGEFETGEEILS